MKIRKGFVSNSSSSSFVCDVCNTVEAGYDGQYDFDTSYCNSGHNFCSDHLGYLNKLTLDDKVKVALKDERFAKTLREEELALLKKKNAFAMEDVFKRFMESWDEVPDCICPLCSLVKIPDWAVIKYLLNKCGMTTKEVEDDLKSKYDSLEELKKGLV